MAFTALTSRSSRAVLVALAAGALTVGPSAIGNAEPNPTPAQASQKIAALQNTMEQATEDYDTARAQLADSKKHSTALAKQAKSQEARVKTFRVKVGDVASATYRNGGLSQASSLLDSGSPQAFVDQMSMLDQLSKGNQTTLSALVSAQKTLKDQRDTIAGEIASQKKHTLVLADRKASIEGNLAKWNKLRSQAVYKSAEKAQRKRDAAVPAAVSGSSRGTSRTAAATSGSSASSGSGSSASSGSPAPQVAASGSAGAAVAYARAQLGKPYVWAATGPSSFDCSGLTMAAWAAAGKSLPHSSRMQFSAGQRVSTSDMQPGDLVFFGSPIHHVGMYIGGGQMIHAPVPGDSVKIASVSIMPMVGAVRP